jgi:hypothetical protein
MEIANVEILVVDDHVLIREALRGVLKELKARRLSWRPQVAAKRCRSSQSIPTWTSFCLT